MSDQIHIDSDEDGFYLEIEDLAVVRITDPEALYDQVKAAIGPWLYERDQARFQLSGEPIDWPIDITPKHPEYHSVHADIHDAREGK